MRLVLILKQKLSFLFKGKVLKVYQVNASIIRQSAFN